MRKTLKRLLITGVAVASLAIGGCAEYTNETVRPGYETQEKKERKEENKEEKQEGLSEGEFLGISGLSFLLNENPADDWIGALLSTIGDSKVKKESVREGRTHVNVYTGKGSRSSFPENVVLSDGKYRPAQGYEWIEPNDVNNLMVRRKSSVLEFFACNNFGDYDKNGKIDYPSDYKGIKKVFKDGEELTLVVHDEKEKNIGDKWKIEIFGPTGKRTHKLEGIYSDKYKSSFSLKEEDRNRNPTQDFIEKGGGYGLFKAIFYYNGSCYDYTEFKIIP